MTPTANPHRGQPVVTAGEPLNDRGPVMIMVHGRNAAPENILSLTPRLNRAGFSYLAPAAANSTWYPYSFLAEREQNEPGLTSGLNVIDELVQLIVARGIAKRRIMLLGFSQGACLTAEFAASHADRYGGVVLFSGGLIGPPGTTWNYNGSFDGTPIFLGCSDIDPHVPKARVDETAEVFARMGAAVTKRIYPGTGHVVNDDEIAFAQGLMDAVRG